MYISVCKIEDCLMLQDDLNRFSAWCGKLELSLNLLQCKVMSYSRSYSLIIFSYQLNGLNIICNSVNVMNLGFKFKLHLILVTILISYVVRL